MRARFFKEVAVGAVVIFLVSSSFTGAQGAGINTDVALTPPRGGSILRLQWFYTEADGRGPADRVQTTGATGTYVYGVREDLSLFFTVPYLHRRVETVDPRRRPAGQRVNRRSKDREDGIGDVRFLGKYRFWQSDPRPQETLRWAALGGLRIRSGDSDFTSDSYDPIVGTVFTWQRDRGWFDADLIYRFGTGRGDFRHDTLSYDLAYSYRLIPAVYDPQEAWELDGVAELNGRYVTNGSHEVFLAPGMQFIAQRWIFEASVQLPVVQELAGDAAETDFRVVVGVRFQW